MELTEAGRERLEEYLSGVRASVNAAGEADPDEVAWDVRIHVEDALSDRPGRVSRAELEEVLERLGDPASWTGGAEPRKAASPVALTAAGLTAVAVLLSPRWGPLALAVLIVAYGVARWAEARGEASSSTTRWLLYPALGAGGAIVLGIALFAPLAISPLIFATGGLLDVLHTTGSSVAGGGLSGDSEAVALWVTVGTGVWWILIGLAASRWPAPVRSALYPLASRFESRHSVILAAAGAVLALVGLAV